MENEILVANLQYLLVCLEKYKTMGQDKRGQ